MTGLDFAVIAILLVSWLIGLWRGLFYEVLSLLGWPVAFVLSRLSADSIASLLTMMQESIRSTVAYALVFIVALIVWGIAARLVAKLLKSVGSVWTDRMMGGLFGIIRGGLIVVVLAWLAGLTQLPEQPFWRGAATSKTLEDLSLLTKAWLPHDLAQRVHYRARS